MRSTALLIFFMFSTGPSLIAQSTNLETFQSLALRCMDFISNVEGALIIDAPAQMPYLRSAITTRLNREGRRVYIADSIYTNQPGNIPTLSYNVETAEVFYERLKKRRAKRTVRFIGSTELISANGMLLEDRRCQEQYSDTLSISDLPVLESGSYPETKAPPLETGFTRRLLQPVMLTAATALTVYLFFTLRSKNGNDGN